MPSWTVALARGATLISATCTPTDTYSAGRSATGTRSRCARQRLADIEPGAGRSRACGRGGRHSSLQLERREEGRRRALARRGRALARDRTALPGRRRAKAAALRGRRPSSRHAVPGRFVSLVASRVPSARPCPASRPPSTAEAPRFGPDRFACSSSSVPSGGLSPSPRPYGDEAGKVTLKGTPLAGLSPGVAPPPLGEGTDDCGTRSRTRSGHSAPRKPPPSIRPHCRPAAPGRGFLG